MKIITLDQAYNLYMKKEIYGFFYMSAFDRTIPFYEFIERLKLKNYYIY